LICHGAKWNEELAKHSVLLEDGTIHSIRNVERRNTTREIVSIVKEGFLKKQGSLGTFHTKWFILKPEALFCYDKPGKQVPVSTIPLHEISAIEAVNNDTFKISTLKKALFCKVTVQTELLEWIRVLKELTGK